MKISLSSEDATILYFEHAPIRKPTAIAAYIEHSQRLKYDDVQLYIEKYSYPGCQWLRVDLRCFLPGTFRLSLRDMQFALLFTRCKSNFRLQVFAESSEEILIKIDENYCCGILNFEIPYLMGMQTHAVDLDFKAMMLALEEVIRPNLMLPLLNGMHKGFEKKLFIEQQIYTCLQLYFSNSNLLEQQPAYVLEAQKLIEANFHQPLSIKMLARMVGVNDFKLKTDFKKYSGYTIFGYVQKIRMELAYALISKAQTPIHEVADRVGYKNPQHFTVAFKKYYKVLPSNLK